MRITSSLLLSFLAIEATNAFVTLNSKSKLSSHVLHMSSEEERAKALSEYLAKAHEEKLRAIQEVEKKKEAEIMALKQQVEQLKQSGGGGGGSAITMAPAGGDLSTLSKEQLINKVVQYQQFMQDYIVKAQEQKTKAVQAAVADINKKWEEKLVLTGGTTTAASPVATTRSTEETKLYDARNAAVAAAAQAGKSRWGDAEVKRAAASAPVASGQVLASPPTPAVVVVPPEVAAADHGLRSDGSVGGPTLAERVSQGVNIGASIVSARVASPLNIGAAIVGQTSGSTSSVAPSVGATPAAETLLYENRNKMVVAAAAAGKSRWGTMEIEKAKNLAALPGKQTSQGSTSLSTSTSIESSSLFQQRNIKVVAAAEAGRSRWGAKEIERAKGLVSALPSAPATTNKASLQERVNLGASLFAN